jgi:hypothetical protein
MCASLETSTTGWVLNLAESGFSAACLAASAPHLRAQRANVGKSSNCSVEGAAMWAGADGGPLQACVMRKLCCSLRGRLMRAELQRFLRLLNFFQHLVVELRDRHQP